MPEPLLSRDHVASSVKDDEDATVYENEGLKHAIFTHHTHCLLFKFIPVDFIFQGEMHQYDIMLQSGNLLSECPLLQHGDVDGSGDYGELEVNVTCLAPGFCLNRDVASVFGGLYGHHLINELQTLNAHSMLGRITETKHKSASPLVMSFELKNVTSLAPILVTFHTLTVFDVENKVLWWGDNRMSSKGVLWNAMPDSVSCHIVFDPGILFLLISMVEMSRYTMLFELSNGWKSSISYKEALSWGNPSHCYEFAMTSSFRALNSYYNVGSEMILLLSKCWKVFTINHSSSRASVAMVNGTHTLDRSWVFILFDPSRLEGDTVNLFFTYTFEDKGDFRGKEDRVYAKHTWKLFNVVLSWYNCLSSWANNSILILAYNSDSVGEELDMKLGICVDTMDSSLCRMYTRCYHGLEAPIEIFVSGLMLVDIVIFEVRRLVDNFVIMPYDPGGILSLRSHFRICDGVSSDNAGTRIVNGKKLIFSVVIYDPGIACDTCSHYSGVMIGFLLDERTSYQNRDIWEGIKLIYADTHVLVFDPGVVGMSIMMFSAFKRVIVEWVCTLNSTHVFDPGGNDEFMSVMRNIFAGDSYSFGLHGGQMDLTFLHPGREIQGNDTIFIFDLGGQALNEVVRLLTYHIRNVLVSIIGVLRLKLFMCANFDP